MALLLSSAGLAASLLVGAAARPGAAWQPLPGFARPASKLAAAPLTYANALPVSLGSTVPTYSFTANAAHGAPLSQLATNLAGTPATTLLPDNGSLKATVQHSWHTFKQAFR